MILSEEAILELIDVGTLKITPFNPNKNLGKCSVHFHLDSRYWIETGPPLTKENARERQVNDEESIIVSSKKRILVETVESIVIPDDYCVFVFPSSRLAIRFLTIECVSGEGINFLTPGFIGCPEFIVRNNTDDPVELLPGIPLAELVFWYVAD